MHFYMDAWTGYSKNSYDYIGGFNIDKDFSFSTQVHGGFSNATVKLFMPTNQARYLYTIMLGCHVEIRDPYYNLIYEGFVRETSCTGSEVVLNILGYYEHAGRLIDDRIYVTSPTTVQTIVDDACDLIDAWNPSIPVGDGADYDLMVTDPETGAYIPIDFTDITIKDALERSLGYGYSAASPTPAFIAIYDNRTPSIMTTVPVSLYKYSGFDIRAHNIVGDLGSSISLDNVKNQIYAVYANEGEGPSKTTSASDAFSISKYGTIEGMIQNGGNPEGLALAEDLRDYALDLYAWPRSNIQVEIQGDIHNFAGSRYAPYHIRAGHHLRFSDLDLVYSDLYATLAGASKSKYITFVTNTSYNSSSNTSTVTVGILSTSFDILMSRLGLSGGLK